MTRPVCRRCGRKPVNRPQNLCWNCYYTPGVRDLYPSTSMYARRSPVPSFGAGRAPAVPTAHPPGTAEKLAEMEARALRGERLFHPADSRFEGDRRPHEFLRRRATA